MNPAIPPARVVLLAGPSGSGKSRIADRSGLPVLKLDDFYRAGTDPDLPRLPTGEIDWDDPDTWHADAAIDAIELLCRSGSAEVPRYELAANGPNGTRTVELTGAAVFVAEGIFVGEIVAACAERGLLDRAICVRRSRWTTMVLRLFRDLRERRKPPLFLIRRGFLLAGAEPSYVAELVKAGCVPASPAACSRYLGSLRSAEPPGSPPPP